MLFQKSDNYGRSGLHELITEKGKLTVQKENCAHGLKSEMGTIQERLEFKRSLQSRLATLEEKLVCLCRTQFCADSAVQNRSGSMDADFLVDEAASEIALLKVALSDVQLSIADALGIRERQMRDFENVGKRLGEVAEQIKEICGEA